MSSGQFDANNTAYDRKLFACSLLQFLRQEVVRVFTPAILTTGSCSLVHSCNSYDRKLFACSLLQFLRQEVVRVFTPAIRNDVKTGLLVWTNFNLSAITSTVQIPFSIDHLFVAYPRANCSTSCTQKTTDYLC